MKNKKVFLVPLRLSIYLNINLKLIVSATLSFLGCLISNLGGAADLIDLQSLSLDYKNYGLINSQQRDLLIYPEHPGDSINVEVNTNLFFDSMYLNSTIESMTTSGQYRGVGLQERLGFYVGDMFELGWYHHSQHVLDRQIESIPTFPSEDAIEFKINLYKRK